MKKMQVDIGDAQLAVEIEGHGPPLLLIAGLGGRLAFWRQQRAALAEQFQLVLHDHRGTGNSSRDEISYSVAQMSQDVLRLLDALDIEKAHLLGHSTGGAIVQHIALYHEQRVESIVLSSSWAEQDPFFRQLFDLRRDILARCGARAYLLDGLLRALPAAWLQQRGDQLGQMLDDRLADFPGEVIEQARIQAVCDFNDGIHAERIAKPTLVICAEDDQITPVNFSRTLAARIPGAELQLLPSGGHFCPQIDAERYNSLVMDFLCR
jgi:aminoacrylate hydrolase